MKDIDFLKERIKAIKPMLPMTGEYNEEYKALLRIIKLMEEVEKVEGVLPKEIPIPKFFPVGPYEGGRASGYNAYRQQAILNLAKTGLVRKPTVEEMKQFLLDNQYVKNIDGEIVTPKWLCYQGSVDYLAQTIIAKLEEGR